METITSIISYTKSVFQSLAYFGVSVLVEGTAFSLGCSMIAWFFALVSIGAGFLYFKPIKMIKLNLKNE